MPPRIEAAELVLHCGELDPTLRFFCEELGFVLRVISPADRPRRAVVEGHGVRLCLQVGDGAGAASVRLRVHGEPPPSMVAPNGTRIEFVAAEPELELPPLAERLVVTSPGDGGGWQMGRAGMGYRDLLPCRLGGRFIASHIRIDEGGAVGDYPHHHRVRFQMIYCHRGWVRLVYEDQGEPFVMRAGDAVLQPPGILHRVLECSPGLEVVEIGCPAEHDTFAEMDRELPNANVDRDRVFDGQRFVWHRADDAEWRAAEFARAQVRDTGMGAATSGLAGARALRFDDADAVDVPAHAGEFAFLFVTHGDATFAADGDAWALAEGAAVAVPAGVSFSWRETRSLELLEVRLPAVSL